VSTAAVVVELRVRGLCCTIRQMSLVDEARAVRERIAARLRELEPLVREYNELQQLAAQMGVGEDEADSASPRSGVELPASPAGPPAPRRRPAGRGGAAPGSTRRRRGGGARQPGGGGDLAARVLAAAQADPGKTVADYAEMLGVAPTALYRPVRQLTAEGALVKRARQLYPGSETR